MAKHLICAATKLESAHLARTTTCARGRWELLTTGVGPVNAAMALTRRLATGGVGTVIALGIGGAYPGAGLEIGDVVCADSETYGDLGADSPEGFLDMEALGFPVVAGLFNTLPLDLFPAPHKAPFVTRSTCTGSIEDARKVVARTGGAVESMEGAAIVHVAMAHGVPVGEIRGISNIAGTRDRGAWRTRESADAAAALLLEWMESNPC
jgi:futalosine hydrolase